MTQRALSWSSPNHSISQGKGLNLSSKEAPCRGANKRKKNSETSTMDQKLGPASQGEGQA